MKAIIPVAGTGTRLRPHTYTSPKVLLHVAGKPILGHILDQLIHLGVMDITFIVGYLGEMVQEFLETSYPMINAHIVHQHDRKGLGHAIWLAKEHNAGDEPLLIILGDTIFQADLCHALTGKRTLIGVKEVEDPRRFGIVERDDNGRVTGLVEKPENPSTNLAIVGIYVIRSANTLYGALDEIVMGDKKTRGEYQLTDALKIMLDKGEDMGVFQVDGWLDCGKPETLLATNRLLLQEDNVNLPPTRSEQYPSSIIIPPVHISSFAHVERSIIGPNVSIAHGAEIHNSIISDSIISEKASVVNIALHGSIISTNASVKGHRTRLNVSDSSELNFE